MANRTCRRCGARVPEATASAAPRTEHTEPVMRRWPHPVECTPAPVPDPMLHYIRCALTYQNELLCEIKTLLEEPVISREEEG